MPGCVRARITEGEGVETFQDDPRGIVTLCDGAVPIFEAPDYRPRDFTWVKANFEAPIKKPELAKPAGICPSVSQCLAPDVPSLPMNLPCPPIGAKEIGSFNKLGTRVITGYELQDGQCVTLWESVAIEQVVRNYIPEAGPTVMVSITAATATMFALYARSISSILQKAAKPVTKKVVKKINRSLGHKEKRESVRERRSEQRYRNEAIRDLRRSLGR